MGPLCDEKRLQLLAEFYQERVRLRTLARGSIVWGAINIALGLYYFQFHFINAFLVLIGLFLFLEGIWFSIRPSALGILIDAAAELLIGLWNVFIVVLDILADAPPRPYWAVIGLVLIGYAVYRLTTFPRLHQLFQEEFNAEELQQVDELIRYITKSRMRTTDDLISVQMGQRQWRAYLGRHSVLFLDMTRNRKTPLAAARADISIEDRGQALLSSMLKVRIRLNDQNRDGRMYPASFAKFQAWKLSDEPNAAAPEPRPQSPTDAFVRRDQIQ